MCEPVLWSSDEDANAHHIPFVSGTPSGASWQDTAPTVLGPWKNMPTFHKIYWILATEENTPGLVEALDAWIRFFDVWEPDA